MAWKFTLSPFRRSLTFLLFIIASFQSVSAQTSGPGGPILVIGTASNQFTKYTAEILRAEGFNSFATKDLTELTSTLLTTYDVVILGETPVTAAQVTIFTNWVNAGGTLIAFRPDALLAPLLGVTKTTGTLADKYILVNTTVGAAGEGIASESMQFHGTADYYNLNGATSIATLYSGPSTATTHPAATYRQVGSNGGFAVAFMYDLARSIVYTRQGNPAWAGQKRDGQPGPTRADDMFFGGSDPSWIDFDKVAIPQADEQQHLLSNIITKGNLHRKPLPRFWFLPRGSKAAVVMTGDDHAFNGTEARFNQNLTQGPNTAQDVANWKSVRTTSYMWLNTPITNEAATAFQNQGFELALHLNTGGGCANFSPESFEADLSDQLAAFALEYPGLDAPATNRTHCMVWNEWATAAKIEAQHGIRLDVNYYYWPASWIQNRAGMFTGSGMPMRFADLDGSMIDCYQVVTQMTDESGINYSEFINQLLDKATGDEGYYGVFCANMHCDSAVHSGADAITAAALARGIPVVTSKQMLTWLDGRNGSSFQNIAWSGNKLSFDITRAAGSTGLRAMLPTTSISGQLSSLTAGSTSVPFTVEMIKGIAYAFFDAQFTGKYTATYTPDVTAPVITNVVATVNNDKSATITWKTNEGSNSAAGYGTNASTITQINSDVDIVTSHEIKFINLALGATYYYRVMSIDAAGNTTITPATNLAPLQFTMPPPPCLSHDASSDFTAGTVGAATIVSEQDGGSVVLKPVLNQEFTGTTLPSGWSSGTFTSNGSVTVASGAVTLSGAHMFSTSSYTPGSGLEFQATFNAGNYQNIGFTADQAFDNPPWITFGQSATNGVLYARASNGVEVSLGPLIGSSHRYLLKWNASNFDFYIDGATTPVGSIPLAVTANMFIQVSDFLATDGNLQIEWMRVTPYAAAGTYTSRVVDAGSSKRWGLMSWNSDTPAGTTLKMSIRTGNTATPDASWSAYVPIAATNSSLNVTSRYIQYKSDLVTTDTKFTPALKGVTIMCATPIPAPVVSQQPASTTTCDGSSATFNSAATGGTPTVQWQESTNGTTWTNITNATVSPFTFTTTATDNNKKYRAVWSNSGGSTNSSAVTLTVKTKPILTSRTSLIALSGQVFNYTATGTSGATCKWARAAVSGVSNSSSTGTISISETLVNTTSDSVDVVYTYTLTYNGCTNIIPVTVTVAPTQNCTTNASISTNFNSISIPSGRKIWFNAEFDPSNLGTGTVNFYVTNGKVQYRLNNQVVTITVPNAHIKFASNINSASTDYTNGAWETLVPSSNQGYAFLSGVPYSVTQTIPGNASNVTWSMDVTCDKPGVSFNWRWNATTFLLLGPSETLNVKPTDDLLSILSPIVTLGNAGCPRTYVLFATAGAMGTGILGISSVYTPISNESCSANRSEPVTSALRSAPSTAEVGPVSLDAVAVPNPSSSQFTLRVTGSFDKAVTITVSNLLGVVIERHENVTANSNLMLGSKWKSGAYFVEIRQGDQKKVIKLMKIN